MMLELGLVPIRYVMMQKRLQFLHYLQNLNQSTNSLLGRVFEALKKNSRQGDFVHLTNKDKKDLDITMMDEEIKSMSKWRWKVLLKGKTKSAAFSYLCEENSRKEKTKDITFDKLEISPYLQEN